MTETLSEKNRLLAHVTGSPRVDLRLAESRDLNSVLTSAPFFFSWLYFWLPLAIILNIFLHVEKEGHWLLHADVLQTKNPKGRIALSLPLLSIYQKTWKRCGWPCLQSVRPCTKSWNQSVAQEWLLSLTHRLTYSGGLNDRKTLQVYHMKTDICLACFRRCALPHSVKKSVFLKKKVLFYLI